MLSRAECMIHEADPAGAPLVIQEEMVLCQKLSEKLYRKLCGKV